MRENRRSRPLKLANGRIVGRALKGVAIFDIEDRHLYRAVGFYSLDAAALADARQDCSEIMLCERSGLRWRISIEDFYAHAKKLPEFGYGTKLACPKSFYRIDGAAYQPALFDIPQDRRPQGHYGQAA